MSCVDPFTALANSKRIVVKVGTSTLTHADGSLNQAQIVCLTSQLATLQDQGREVVLVTSGAIGVGAARLGLTSRPQTIPGKQAAAAIGQTLLMNVYEKHFRELGKIVAQVLLTRGDLEDRHRYLNAHNTLSTLLRYGVIPIINENDTVAVDELKFGDNDTLAAMVVGLVEADLIVILTDIDGVYTKDPRTHPDAQKLVIVEQVTPELKKIAGGSGTSLGTGGMQTKLTAARIATAAGASLVIAQGSTPGVLEALLAGQQIGTLFLPRKRRLPRRKQWLAFSPPVAGAIIVDAGAQAAIVENGKSLLPSGIVATEGNFATGALVRLIGPEGYEFARGLVNYSTAEIDQIRGCTSKEIAKILGHSGKPVVIHRDDLVLI